jgi:hypothetical protein
VVAAHAASDHWVAPDRGPRVTFNAGARAWQLCEVASRRAAATRLQRPDRRATAEEAVADKWATTKFFSIMKLNRQKLN